MTICTKDKKCYFGKIVNGDMHLSSVGAVVKECWLAIPEHFPFVTLDEYVIMPNHVHGIIIIGSDKCRDARFCVSTINNDGGNKYGSQSKNLGSIIRGFKIGVTKWSTENKINFAWQPRFYDHILRNDKSLYAIRKYIQQNPQKWELDKFCSEN